MRLLLAGCVLALFLAACGSAAAGERARAPERAPTLPSSDRDPLPYTPTPEASGHTDQTVALSVAGGEDQARRMLPALLTAVRDADERRLEQLLAEEVSSAQNREGRGRPRSALIAHVLRYARRSVIQPDARVEDLVDLPNVRVSRAAQFWTGRDTPEGVHPTDLVVEVPLLQAGRAPLRTMLGWHLRGHLVVRPGRDPRVVAL
jgi:hypothetical protein